MKNKFKTHLIFWTIYFVYITYAEYAYLDTFLPEHVKNITFSDILYYSFITEIVMMFSVIPCFYSLLSIIDSNQKSVAKKIIYSILIITFFIVFFRITINDFVWGEIYPIEEKYDTFSLFGIFNALMNIGYGVSLAMGIEKFRQQLVIHDELNELKNEKLKNEIKFLKTQINPHFLFNTLNNIYGLAIKKSEDTPEVILKLAKIMRYNIYESSRESVSLANEIENIQDYIDINKLRHKNLSIKFEYNTDNNAQEISPLILLQFVENAFKHGASESVNKSFIYIKLILKNGLLNYQVSNSLESVNQNSTKIGLQNIKRQLELLYPNRHELIINQSDTSYEIFLKIDFNYEF